MTRTIDPRLLYSESTFFIDYIERKRQAAEFFQYSDTSVFRLAEAQQSMFSGERRAEVCDKLLAYNRSLNAPSRTMAHIETLRDRQALCVIGGQQAGFLGGPLFVLYKIASIIQTAARLSALLGLPVVPIFWLASEDHDFTEINHIRFIDDSSTLRTMSFPWEGEGRPIESLSITEPVALAFEEAKRRMPSKTAADAALFSPATDDTYCRWHARIWSRLFADSGLILVEPHVLRHCASAFFARAIADRSKTQLGLTESATRLRDHGYPIPLDPDRSGILFEITDEGLRKLFLKPYTEPDLPNLRTFSSDAATRPLLADSLLPNVANVLGPSELSYHAMLRPLYEQWAIPQPLAVPRNGATVLSARDFQALSNWGIDVSALLEPSFDPADMARSAASSKLSGAFESAKQRMEDALVPLRSVLEQIDPGLELRWHQTLDQARHQVDRLEERSTRADLARRGLSVKALQNLKPLLLPMDKPQERILSSYSFIARYGVTWIHDLVAHGGSDQFEHQLIILEETHE